jgi:hypothetical protein
MLAWLLFASGLARSLNVPGEAWVNHLVETGQPLPLAAQLNASAGSPCGRRPSPWA